MTDSESLYIIDKGKPMKQRGTIDVYRAFFAPKNPDYTADTIKDIFPYLCVENDKNFIIVADTTIWYQTGA
jgi:hypothetical protein